MKNVSGPIGWRGHADQAKMMSSTTSHQNSKPVWVPVRLSVIHSIKLPLENRSIFRDLSV